MKEYHVVWKIDLSANDHEDAAETAFEIMQRPTFATTFDVIDENDVHQRVDLGTKK